jgi:hypothetical protein
MIPLFESKDFLPSNLGDFSYDWIIENEDPKYGFQARYGRGASKVDLYLYDAGCLPIPQDVSDPIILSHFQSCIEDITLMAQSELYQEFEVGPIDGLEVISGIRKTTFLHWQFEYLVPDSSLTVDIGCQRSHLLLSSQRGYFSKIRFSYPVHDRDARIRDLYGLLQDWCNRIETI